MGGTPHRWHDVPVEEPSTASGTVRSIISSAKYCGSCIDTVGQLLQVRLRGERIVGGEREGVAVGFRLDEVADAEGSGRTALVVDDDRLSKRLGNLDLQRPGHDVGVSAGRERHDDGD